MRRGETSDENCLVCRFFLLALNFSDPRQTHLRVLQAVLKGDGYPKEQKGGGRHGVSEECWSLQESVAKGGGHGGGGPSRGTREATDSRKDIRERAEQVCKRMLEVEQIDWPREIHESAVAGNDKRGVEGHPAMGKSNFD